MGTEKREIVTKKTELYVDILTFFSTCFHYAGAIHDQVLGYLRLVIPTTITEPTLRLTRIQDLLKFYKTKNILEICIYLPIEAV